jgi:putative ABC transport system ATP-binding protein
MSATNTDAAPLASTHTAARVADLTKVYGEGDTAVHALAGVSLHLAAGQFTAIMGPSGSGKSTLLHTMAGLDTPTSGTIELGDTDITSLSDTKLTLLRRDKLGFIFQSFNLLPTLTALENITLPLSIAGRKPDPQWLDTVIDTGRPARAAVTPAERAVRGPAAAGRRCPRAGQPAADRVRRRTYRSARLAGRR